MNVTRQQWFILFATAGLVLAIDQITKALIVANFALRERQVPIPALGDVFNLTYTQNTGAAFGLFPAGSNVFLLIAIIATGVIIYYYREVPQGYLPMRIALGMMMGGALGNATDRMTRGFVVDFLHVFYEPAGFNWPIFNIADSSVVIGVGIMIVMLWWMERQEQASTEESLVPEEEQSV